MSEEGLFRTLRSAFKPRGRRIESDAGGSAAYAVYNASFDRTVTANDLADAIGPIPGQYATACHEAWQELQFGLLSWKTKLLIQCAQRAEDLCGRVGRDKLADTAVTLLFDQSGSMRGQKMLYAAATAELAVEFLKSLDVKVEILGFTTRNWKGGRSREAWIRNGRPANPGRLNDLLHIIYYDADTQGEGGIGHALSHMLRPDLLKENIDGEAIEWAGGRLRRRAEKHKILLVISDGASVDDATLSSNPPDYLERHLLHVIDQFNKAGDIDVCAVGLEHRVDRYYPKSMYCSRPDILAETVLDLLGERILARTDAERQTGTGL